VATVGLRGLVRVLIVGAGVAGQTLAFCLQRRGVQALVVERVPSLPTAGYMTSSARDTTPIERLGLREELESIHYPVERLVFLDPHGRERFALPYSVLRKELFADRHFNFLRGDLVRLLHGRVKERSRSASAPRSKASNMRPPWCARPSATAAWKAPICWSGPTESTPRTAGWPSGPRALGAREK
jgi:glycine/D-amino acid oxidase-like deaminating enzyme